MYIYSRLFIYFIIIVIIIIIIIIIKIIYSNVERSTKIMTEQKSTPSLWTYMQAD